MRERKGKSLRVKVLLAFGGIFKLNCQLDLGEGGENIYTNWQLKALFYYRFLFVSKIDGGKFKPEPQVCPFLSSFSSLEGGRPLLRGKMMHCWSRHELFKP